MQFLFIILFASFSSVYAHECPVCERQGAPSHHLPDDPEKALQFVQTLLKQKCDTGENPAACFANELLTEQCRTDNPASFCLSKQGILLASSSAFFPHIPALHFSPQELNRGFLNQGRPEELIDKPSSPALRRPFYELNGGLFFDDNLQEQTSSTSLLLFPQRDMKIACTATDDPKWCLGWIDSHGLRKIPLD